MGIKKQRIYFIDALRGALILIVVLYHLLYDLNMYRVVDINLNMVFFSVARPAIAGAFCLISGISQNLSKNRLRRAVILVFIAYAITLVTFIYDKNMVVLFGILHCIGFSALIYALLKKYIDKVPLLVWLVLFTAFIFIKLPVVNAAHLYMFGFIQSDFSSSDYYPLLPWMFIFLLGTKLSKDLVYLKKASGLYKKRLKFFEFLGRNTLVIYLAHQPVIIGIFTLLKL